MLKLTFYLKQVNEDELALRLFWGFRAVFLVLFALVVGSVLVEDGTAGGAAAGVSPLAVILLIVFALIAVYDERWTFIRSEGRVVHAHGILVIHKRTSYAVSEISGLEVTKFRKGSVGGEEKRRFFQRDLLRFSVIFAETGYKDIEITEARNKTDLQGKAAAIADFMNLSYHSEV
ncbi:MAG: hypothetical protein ACP5IA_01950 [Sediminispirochaetaceae bacterium]